MESIKDKLQELLFSATSDYLFSILCHQQEVAHTTLVEKFQITLEDTFKNYSIHLNEVNANLQKFKIPLLHLMKLPLTKLKLILPCQPLK